MPTLTLSADQLGELRPGDRITAVDGHPIARTVLGQRADGGVSLVNALGTDTAWALYPDQVAQEITVRRRGPQYDAPIGPELPVPSERTLKAIRRNPDWPRMLAWLAQRTDEDPRGVHVGRSEGCVFGGMSSYGNTLTERGPGRRWRITLAGRLALAEHNRRQQARDAR